MRINEILVESTLEEGPILNKIGSGIGKAAGTVAKGVGAVAGGIAGIPGAVKKGFQAGKATVAGGGDTDAGGQAAPTASGGTAPAAPAAKQPGLLQKIGQAAGDFKKGFQQGAGQPAEPAAQAPAAAAPAATANTQAPAQPAQAPAAGAQQPAAAPTGTAYAQVKAGVDKLDKKGKQRIFQVLQKEVGTPAAKPAAKSAAGAAPAAAQDDVPMNPATGKPLTEPERAAHQAAGGKFDGVSGDPLPLGTKVPDPEVDFEKKLADLQAKRAAEKAAAQPAPAAAASAATPKQPSTGQAAAAAQAAGQDPEQAALAAMQKNNPNLQKLMAKNKQPVNISGKKKAAAPQQQVASKEPKGNMVAESFSIFRKR
jgi:hypothetical protein